MVGLSTPLSLAPLARTFGTHVKGALVDDSIVAVTREAAAISVEGDTHRLGSVQRGVRPEDEVKSTRGDGARERAVSQAHTYRHVCARGAQRKIREFRSQKSFERPSDSTARRADHLSHTAQIAGSALGSTAG